MSAPQPSAERRPATYQDLLDAPEHMIAQILDGELLLSPRPAGPHTHGASIIGIDIGGPFFCKPGGGRGPGGWWILHEPELHLGPHVVVPDLVGWRRERMAVYPRGAYVTLPPDWVCEVVSPSTASVDRIRKMQVYAHAAVPWVWLVDPLAKTLEVFQLREGFYSLVQAFAGNETVRAKPFDAVALEMERWWIPEEKEAAAAEETRQGEQEAAAKTQEGVEEDSP